MAGPSCSTGIRPGRSSWAARWPMPSATWTTVRRAASRPPSSTSWSAASRRTRLARRTASSPSRMPRTSGRCAPSTWTGRPPSSGRRGQRGLLVLLCPAYLGYVDPHYPGYEGRPEGWYDLIVPQPVATLRDYGRRVAQALAHLDNIAWVLAGDRLPGEALPHMEAMAEGIREVDPEALFTAHVHPGRRPLESFPWLDLNQVYSYGIVHRRVHDEYRLEPPRPCHPLRVDLRERGRQHAPPAPPAVVVGHARWRLRAVLRQQAGVGRLPGLAGGARLAGCPGPGTPRQLPREQALVAPRPRRRGALHRRWGRGAQRARPGRRGHRRRRQPGPRLRAPGPRDRPGPHGPAPRDAIGPRWFDPAGDASQAAGTYAAAGRWSFTPPWPEDAVLELERLPTEPTEGR